MLKLESNIGFDGCECTVTQQDATNFKTERDDGFYEESVSIPYDGVDFHISDGYLFTVILRSKYNGEVELVNKNELIRNIPTSEVDPVYEKNFPVVKYTLPQDGLFTIKRLFVVSMDYFNNMLDEDVYDQDKVLVYYDEDRESFFKVEQGLEVEIDLVDLAVEFDNNYLGSYVSHKIFSTCYLKQCNFKLHREYLNSRLGLNVLGKKAPKRKCLVGCEDDDSLAENRDFIHTTMHVLDYLIGCSFFDDALRLLESLGKCGSICKQFGVQNTGCGCG